MRHNAIYISIALFSLLFACQQKESSPNVFNIEKDPLDKINMSEFFEVVSVDAIDEGNEDLITEVYKVKYRGPLVYLLDRFDGKKISVYNHESGEFLYSIGYSGEGPGGFSIPYDFYIDEDTKSVKVLSVGKILNYSLENGEYIDQEFITLPAVRFSRLSNGNWLFFLGRSSDFQVAVTDSSYEVLRSHLPRFRMHNMLAWETIITTDDNKTLIVRNFDNQVYEVTEDNELATFVQLDFGDEPIPDEEKDEVSKSSEISAKYADVALLRRTFYASTNYLMFVYQQNGKYNVVVRNLKSNDYISFDGRDVNNDLLLDQDSNFPLIIGMDSEGNFISRVRSNIRQSSDGSIVPDESRNSEALTLIRLKPKF